ncbi:MAG: OmpA family protein [Gemmatimonadetes bacterium]|nr:OmpA family protein [Gemmatimonadota bacterium]MBT8479772.1 OmpA family protein [Gemmatimonadota bacterium]NNK49562.1 OmpA family protein [Gemmatimonadota bacterium]
MSSVLVRFTLVAVVAVAAGCGKVSQDQFDQSMANMQSQLDEQRGSIEANAEGIDALQVEMDALQAELEELAEEYHAMVERYQDHIMFASPVNFAFDSYDVRPGDDAFLERFAQVVAHHYANSVVTVQGYTDAAGPEEYNKFLSQKRAENVAGQLVEHGLDAGHVRAIGMGEAHQVAPGEWGDAEGGLKNRRVTFVIESAS